MSVAQAQREIDSQEFASWQAYDRIDPFGQDRADLGTATVAAVVANANRGKGVKAFQPSDFMPSFEPKPRQSAVEIQSRMFQFAEIHNQSLRKT